jgi:hypothetical protein
VANLEVSRRELGFSQAVESEFEFLKESGFEMTHVEPTLVRFETDRVFVNVYHGRSSYIIGVEIGTINPADQGWEPDRFDSVVPLRPAPLSEKFTIWEVARAAGASDVHENTFLQASSKQGIAHCVRRIADFVKRYGEMALNGDAAFFTRVREVQTQESRHFLARGRLSYLQTQLNEAWHGKDYRRFVQLLEPLESDLPPAERRRLEYARKHRHSMGETVE